MQNILITGGTGLVGNHLIPMLLAKGYSVTVLSRNSSKQSSTPNLTYATWNVEQQTIDATAIQKASYIIHLAGAGVADKRWTTKRKQEIVDSRTQSSALLIKALQQNENNVKAIVSASAIGWYGADNLNTKAPQPLATGFTEDAPADTQFLGETCRLWEASIEPVTQLQKRLVKLRIGIVLSKDGGALKEFIKPIKFGLATILGSGKQVVSWIAINDLCRMFVYALENENMAGSYNAVAPNPVTNKQLTLAIAQIIKGKFFITAHVPSFVLKLILGEMSIEILKSATVSCHKIKTAGFTFMYPTVDAALKSTLTEQKH
jgi:uncharacterized protein